MKKKTHSEVTARMSFGAAALMTVYGIIFTIAGLFVTIYAGLFGLIFLFAGLYVTVQGALHTLYYGKVASEEKASRKAAERAANEPKKDRICEWCGTNLNDIPPKTSFCPECDKYIEPI